MFVGHRGRSSRLPGSRKRSSIRPRRNPGWKRYPADDRARDQLARQCGARDELVETVRHRRTDAATVPVDLEVEAHTAVWPRRAQFVGRDRDRRHRAGRYLTGKRIVAMVEEDLKPSDDLTKGAFQNAFVINSAIGGSTNAPITWQPPPAHRPRSADSGLANVRPQGAANGQSATGGRLSLRGFIITRVAFPPSSPN